MTMAIEQLKWISTEDGVTMEAWLILDDGKGYRLGSITQRVVAKDPQLKEQFVALMKQAAVAAIKDLKGGGSVQLLDSEGRAS